MDTHLKKLFLRYNEQFGSGPGLGPGSGTCLMNIESISPSFIKSLYKAAASLYRTDPWKRFQPNHLFGIKVGKDSDWPGKKQLFPCIQFIGKNGGDLALYMFRSETDAKKSTGSRETIRVPNLDIMRITYESESLMFPSHKKMIKSLCLEISGTDRYPVFDICRSNSSNELRFRNPTIEELRFVYGVMKSVSLVHSLLQEDYNNNNKTQKWSKFIHFEPFIETVDVQWPSEMSKGNNDIVAVTISHPPGHTYGEKVNSNPGSTQSTPTKKTQFINNNLFDLRQCAQCDKQVPIDHVTVCDKCKGVIYCDSFCQKQQWKESHKAECGVYKAMMEREEELRIPTFTFPCSDSDVHPCKYLETIRVHRKGMWRRKCPCFTHCPFGLLPTTDQISDSWGGLNDEEYPSEKSKSNPVVLSGWVEYYNIQSLPLSSPVAHILSHPLTVYYILTTLSITSKNLLLKGKNVILHYIGPEEELDWMPAFSEIDSTLNGPGNLQIVMIGPKVPSTLSGLTFQTGARVCVNTVKGVYEEEAGFLPRPDLVVGLNCGFESCSSWFGALEVIKSKNLPGFFTDQSEVLCGKAKQVIRGAGLHITHPVTPNPFRSPVRNYGLSSNLPSYSNGFVFGVNT